MSDWFVSTDWLAANLRKPGLALLDASWYLPNSGRDAHAEYLAGHIPEAGFFDIDAVADLTTNLPHMLPTPDDFAGMAGAMGVSESNTIVIYDEAGLFSAPRVAWTFATMGATDVKILAGGGAKWRAENRPLEIGLAKPRAAVFTTRFNPAAVADYDSVNRRRTDAQTLIVDARPADRFNAEVPEPRAGLRAGHIPGSINVPFDLLSTDGQLKTRVELGAIFATAGIDLDAPIITTCGSGITASTLALALNVAGAEDVAVYDGSWTEWGGRADAAIAP